MDHALSEYLTNVAARHAGLAEIERITAQQGRRALVPVRPRHRCVRHAFAILARDRSVGIFALLLATAVSIARVASGTHYLSDVIGGAALGGIVALALLAPPIRRRLDGLADAVGALYERMFRSIGIRPGGLLPAGG